MRGCVGWSALLFFANPRGQLFLHRGPYIFQKNYNLYFERPSSELYLKNANLLLTYINIIEVA